MEFGEDDDVDDTVAIGDNDEDVAGAGDGVNDVAGAGDSVGDVAQPSTQIFVIPATAGKEVCMLSGGRNNLRIV